MTVANRLISKSAQVACSNVIFHLLVPVRFVKRLKPSPELGPLGRWQLLNCSLNLFKGAHESNDSRGLPLSRGIHLIGLTLKLSGVT
jgi:hypothetical protein